jgi:hypothetical protein
MTMRSHFAAWIFTLMTTLIGCSAGSQQGSSTCSQSQSILKHDSIAPVALEDTGAGLLLAKHFAVSEETIQEPMTSEEVMSQCNSALELLQIEPPKIRLWTASHCIKPLLITSLTLAIRDKRSPTGAFYKWNLSHPILEKAKRMRDAFSGLSGGSLNTQRLRLLRAFDRRNMLVEGSSAVLEPRVACENLRWSQQADSRHSLCFSIFDLVNLDFELPEPNSEKSIALIDVLKSANRSSSTTEKLSEKRETFLRRMHTTSQTEWIIHEGNRVRQFMSSFSRNIFPFFSEDVLEIEKLNREVFSLPHPEEFGFMNPQSYTTQDAKPPAVNSSYQAISHGTYVSPRTTIENVNVTCHRQLNKYNNLTNKVEVLPELETRPHEFCPGGAQFQPDHFWNRDRTWSWMMADMTLGAAQTYSQAILDSAEESADLSQRLARFNIVSSFGLSENLGFQNILSDLSTPLLRHLRIPASAVTSEIFGLGAIQQTGAFVLSLPHNETRARFLKGDSGSIVLLDGVPIATLYSVDGEETSGGSSILPLPELKEDDDTQSVTTSTAGIKRKGQAPISGCK